MKAALLEKPHELRVVHKDLRRLDDSELLIRVEACGICGTDVHIVEGTSRSSPPVILGHEYTGRVEDKGKLVRGFSVGNRVAVDPNISCGTCFYCRRSLVHLCERLRALGVDIDGGMAEFSIVPAAQAYLLPQEMSPDISAFVEPLSCAVHGVDRVTLRPGDTVVILGGGTIGLIMLQLVRNAGAASIILVEPIKSKRTVAQLLGADHLLDPGSEDVVAAVTELTGGGADVVFECVGKVETMRLAVALARRGGTVEFFGVAPIGQTMPVEPNTIYFKELTIVGSYVNPHTFSRAIALLRSGKVRVSRFQIDRFPLDGVHEALLYQREGRTLKSLIQPQT